MIGGISILIPLFEGYKYTYTPYKYTYSNILIIYNYILYKYKI